MLGMECHELDLKKPSHGVNGSNNACKQLSFMCLKTG